MGRIVAALTGQQVGKAALADGNNNQISRDGNSYAGEHRSSLSCLFRRSGEMEMIAGAVRDLRQSSVFICLGSERRSVAHKALR